VKLDSHDPDRQVGVVIVSQSGEVLATGTNRPPESMHLSIDESLAAISRDPSWKYFVLEHAERNAINHAVKSGHSLAGATMYGTLFPCADCSRAIVAFGIRRLVVPLPSETDQRNEKWKEHFRYANEIFTAAGTLVDFTDTE
jgi:dCMP deaminase